MEARRDLRGGGADVVRQDRLAQLVPRDVLLLVLRDRVGMWRTPTAWARRAGRSRRARTPAAPRPSGARAADRRSASSRRGTAGCPCRAARSRARRRRRRSAGPRGAGPPRCGARRGDRRAARRGSRRAARRDRRRGAAGAGAGRALPRAVGDDRRRPDRAPGDERRRATGPRPDGERDDGNAAHTAKPDAPARPSGAEHEPDPSVASACPRR